jgi:hypothetical protein
MECLVAAQDPPAHYAQPCATKENSGRIWQKGVASMQFEFGEQYRNGRTVVRDGSVHASLRPHPRDKAGRRVAGFLRIIGGAPAMDSEGAFGRGGVCHQAQGHDRPRAAAQPDAWPLVVSAEV